MNTRRCSEPEGNLVYELLSDGHTLVYLIIWNSGDSASRAAGRALLCCAGCLAIVSASGERRNEMEKYWGGGAGEGEKKVK